jgi:hypothetical protein
MTDDGIITNKMLLEHIQAGNNSLRHEFKKDIERLEKKMDRKFADVDRRFEEARTHREGIQEDLEATIKMQASHDRELAVLTGRPLPEEY